jgi:ABC-type transport system substrate-binding protein
MGRAAVCLTAGRAFGGIIPDIPVFANEIPSVQNGEISAAYTTMTGKLIRCGNTINRWSDPKYDEMYAQLKRELDPDTRKAIAKQLDDYIIADGIRIPMIIRNDVYASRPDLINVEYSPFSSEAWNIGHWRLKK